MIPLYGLGLLVLTFCCIFALCLLFIFKLDKKLQRALGLWREEIRMRKIEEGRILAVHAVLLNWEHDVPEKLVARDWSVTYDLAKNLRRTLDTLLRLTSNYDMKHTGAFKYEGIKELEKCRAFIRDLDE